MDFCRLHKGIKVIKSFLKLTVLTYASLISLGLGAQDVVENQPQKIVEPLPVQDNAKSVFELESGAISLEKNIGLVPEIKPSTEITEEILFEKEIPYNETFEYWAQTGNIEKIKSFLNNGANINSNIYEGNTLPLIATMRNNKELIKTLIPYKPNWKRQNQNKENIFHIAIRNGDIELLTILEGAIAKKDINELLQKENKNGALPYFLFFQRKNLDIGVWNWLKKYDMNFNHKDKAQLNVLHYAMVPVHCSGFEILKNEVDLSIFKQDYSICEKEEIIEKEQ